MLSVAMLSVPFLMAALSVVLLNVVAPLKRAEVRFRPYLWNVFWVKFLDEATEFLQAGTHLTKLISRVINALS